eukprot:Colp12_sorted_trinity150504_noHs@32366
MKYVLKNGLVSYESYPYQAVQLECRAQPSAVAAKISSFGDVESGSEEALKRALVKYGPIAVAIDSSTLGFSLYSKGVFYDEKCSATELNHGVVLVGYGTTEKGEDYWIIKNSWGESWGNQGYMLMARNRGNNCGIATAAVFAVGAH